MPPTQDILKKKWSQSQHQEEISRACRWSGTEYYKALVSKPRRRGSARFSVREWSIVIVWWRPLQYPLTLRDVWYNDNSLGCSCWTRSHWDSEWWTLTSLDSVGPSSHVKYGIQNVSHLLWTWSRSHLGCRLLLPSTLMAGLGSRLHIQMLTTSSSSHFSASWQRNLTRRYPTGDRTPFSS